MVKPLEVANPKVTMEFDMQPQGWTESHFYTSVVPITDVGLYAAMLSLCVARTAALDGRYAQLVACKASIDNVNRDVNNVLTQDLPARNSGGDYPLGPPFTGSIWTYNGPQSAWPVKLQTSQTTTNPLVYITIGSLPSTQTGRGPQDAPGLNVLFAINRYLSELTGGNWGALGRTFTVPGVTYTLTAIAYVPAAGAVPAQLEFTTLAPFPAASVFPPGSFVALNGATYTTAQNRLRLNGTYTVQAYNPTTGVVTVNVPRLRSAPTFGLFGGLTPASAAVFPYAAGIVRNLTHRKRGRPLDAARGRK